MAKPSKELRASMATESGPPVPEALGQSDVFLAFQERLSRAAPVTRPVLIVGERGTGKELAARRLHYLSGRWQGPFVALNCAALSPNLLESELFGHEAGAFTGATHQRAGRFEAASGGTLFLDEIGQIPKEVQEKILRVVEYGAFERVGSSRAITVDVRLVGATNADLKALVRQDQFKADLLDRLAFEVLFVPPMRERSEDIEYLANHFASRMAYELGREGLPQLTEEAIEALRHYHWPGNVRELKNVVERAVFRAESDEVAVIDFDPFRDPYASAAPEGPPGPETVLQANKGPQGASSSPTAETPQSAVSSPAGLRPLPEAIQEVEIKALRQALAEARYNQRQAARLLGLSYHQFRGLYRKHRATLE